MDLNQKQKLELFNVQHSFLVTWLTVQSKHRRRDEADKERPRGVGKGSALVSRC